MLIPQEHEVDDRGQSIRSIKCKFSSFGAYRINGKTQYAPRGHRIVQNVDWISSALAGELTVRFKTLPAININYKRHNCLLLHIMLYLHVLPAGDIVLFVGVPSQKSCLVACKSLYGSDQWLLVGTFGEGKVKKEPGNKIVIIVTLFRNLPCKN